MRGVSHFKCLFIKTPAVTDIATNIDCGQKVHLNSNRAIAPAVFASAAAHIKTKAARFPASDSRVFGRGKKFPNINPGTDVGGRIRTGRAANRRLININHSIYVFGSDNSLVSSGFIMDLATGSRLLISQSLIKHIINQARLA